MEPLSIATAVVGLTATCLTTCRKLSDLAGSYGDVPVMIAMICSESTVISIALSELQMKILRRDDLSQAWASKNEILAVFETVLTGCMTVFSCLEAETRRLQSQNQGVWAKLKFMWSRDRLKDLLDALRGQQTSIGFLLKVLEIDTLSDIQKEIRVNKSRIQASVTEAQSLRSQNPSIKIQSQSIFDNDIAKLSFFDVEAISAIAPSELDFEFDDLVLNSQAYRRAFARAQAESGQPQRHVVEGDLIDFSENTIHNSDAATIREDQDLEDLTLEPTSNNQQPTSDSKSPSDSIINGIKIDQSPRLQRRNSWDEPDTNFCTREMEGQSNQGKESSLQTQMSAQKNVRTFRECSKCSELITSQHVKALNAFWHLPCFTCADCGEVVAAKFFPLDAEDKGQRKVLCETDYFRRLDLLCFACSKALRGSYVSAGGRRYHPDHLKCDECHTLFGAQDSYYEHEGGVYCYLHYSQNYAESCDFCKLPILAHYMTHSQGRIKKYSHPTCYFMKRDWDIALPLTPQGRENAIPLDCDILRMREEHEACIERVYQVTSKFLDAFREELANTSDAYVGDKQAEAFEHYKLLIALTSVALKAVSEVGEGAIGDSGMGFLSQDLHYYLEASFIATSVNEPTRTHIEAVITSLKSILKPVLETSYSKSRAAGSTLDKFLVALSATKLPLLYLPYVSEPSSKDESGMKCEHCHLYVRSTAYSAISTPDLRWHPDCWKCEKCEQPVHIVSSKSQNKIEHSEYECRCCGCEGSFRHIPDYSQFVYIMWRAWDHVTALDWSQP